MMTEKYTQNVLCVIKQGIERSMEMIVIKGAEMPKHCMTCEFHDQMYNRCNIGHFETGAKFIKGDDKWYFKHPNCPLVEIATCKDCKHREKVHPSYLSNKKDEVYFCTLQSDEYCYEVEDDHFCADAEMRVSCDWWNAPYKGV